MEDDGEGEREARGCRDGYCDVDRSSKSWEHNKREESQVEAEDRQLGEHVDECVVEFQIVNQLTEMLALWQVPCTLIAYT